MTRRQRSSGRLWITTAIAAGVLGFSGMCGPLAAQDPFGADPFAPGAPAAPAAGGAAPVAPSPLNQDDPVVLAIRESNPTTPEDLVLAAKTMMDYGRPDEAKRYLARLLAAKPDNDALAKLQSKFGSGLFMQMIRRQDVQPEGTQFGQAVLQGGHQAATDPARLQKLVDQLNDPAPEVRRAAIIDLRGAQEDAIGSMVRVLADPKRAAEHAGVRDALVQLGELAIQPLMGVMAAPDDALKAQVIEVLGRLKDTRAVVYITRPALSSKSNPNLREAARMALVRIVGVLPTQSDGELYLYRQGRRFFDGERPGPIDHEDMIEVWNWDTLQQAGVPRRLPAQEASLVVAARVAAELYALAPNNRDYRRLYLATQLEAAKVIGGMDQPLATGAGTAHSIALAAGADAVEDLLSHAIESGRIPAAIGAAEVLGDTADLQLLLSDDGRERTLARCLSHPDRRLRFAAAGAILKLDPKVAFPGSSRVPELLGYLVRTTGQPRALIADPRTTNAQSVVGMLSQLGFEGETAPTGRQAFQRAIANSDYEFILISDAIDTPNANELMQMLRRDSRTANLPIGLMARNENEEKARQLAELDPLTISFPRPHDVATVALMRHRLYSRAGRDLVNFDERLRQADAALDQIIRLSENPADYSFYDLLRQQDALAMALQTPALARKAARALGLFGSPQAQRALVDMASQNARPLAERQAAAAAFQTAVERRGTLLTTAELLVQYERYNQSETLDRETQLLLASILDAIESRVAKTDEGQPAKNGQP